jgi:hypothetical protein
MTKKHYQGYSNHLNRRTAENICHAFDFANYLRCPLNTYIVLKFSPADAIAAGHVFRAIMRKYRYWLKSRTENLPPMYVYTFENPTGHPHVNWVVHVPQIHKKEFGEKFNGWAEKANAELGEYDAHKQAVNLCTSKTLAKYIIKGIDPLYIEYLHLGEFACPQGTIWGRRATASPAISRAVRKAAGFVPKRDRGKLQQAANDDARRNAA